MNLFKKKTSEAYTIIIGCGRLGSKIANTLSDREENVLVIDKTGNSFRRLFTEYGGLSIVGDGTSTEVLKDAKIETASTVIAATNKDNVNILVAQMAKKMFHVPHVIVRLFDPEKRAVLEGSDIEIVCPALLSASEIEIAMQNEKTLKKEKMA